MQYKKIFVESYTKGYPLSSLDNDLDFFYSKNLIKVDGDKFTPLFVGEIITPNGSYFSLPKNFKVCQDNVELFKRVLIYYRDLKGSDGQTLLTNNSFVVDKEGKLESEKYYYRQLRDFFMDFITYEFIYPAKPIRKHTTTAPKGGKIDVVSTMFNRRVKGSGYTYKVRDIKNHKSWNLDDIYWTTLFHLSEKYATQIEKNDINDLKEFIVNQGYEFDIIKIDSIDIIRQIEKCEVGIIHQPIKNTLIDFYRNCYLTEKYNLNIFYTLKFQYVWEEISRKSLKHDDFFKNQIKQLYINHKPTRRNWDEGDEEKEYRDFNPDVFSKHNSKTFIGDAKYYQDPNNSQFDKEMYSYNTLIDNSIPMCVFIPSDRTKRTDVRRHRKFELLIFNISAEQAIKDSMEGTNITIDRVHELIMKNTRRKF